MSDPLQTFRARRDKMLAQLGGLCSLADRMGATTLSSRLARELVGKLERDEFHLVVVGEFNHGKTSLVNALLGKALLPVGVTPTTAAIHHVHHSATPEARVVYADGSTAELPLAEVPRFALRHGAADAARSASAEPDSSGGGAGPSTEPEVSYLDIGLPAEILRERIVLVDTPGVNDLCLQRADITFNYIPQSDAVLFVLDAGQPLKESERLFLQDKLIGQSRDKIIFVVAKSDIWTEADRTEALAYIEQELSRLLPKPVVFPVSPQRALAGELEPSGLTALVSHLTRFLGEERGRIMLDNAIGDGLAATGAIERSIDARRRTVRMSTEELVRRIASVEADLATQEKTLAERQGMVREETASILAWVRRDLERFGDDVLRQLADIIDKAPVEDLKPYLPGFVELTFVRWAQAEADEIARALEALSEKMVALLREDAHDAAARLSTAAGGDVAPPDLSMDTFGYDVGVFALFTLGLGMLFSNLLLGSALTVAAPVLALYLRGRVELETRQRAKEQAEKALREAIKRVGPKLDQMVSTFAERLGAWMLQAGSEQHRELIDVLSSARAARIGQQPEADHAEAECDEHAKELAALREALANERTALWGQSEPARAAPQVP